MSIRQLLAVVATIIRLDRGTLDASARQAPLVDPERVRMINATSSPMTAGQVRTADRRWGTRASLVRDGGQAGGSHVALTTGREAHRHHHSRLRRQGYQIATHPA